MKKKSLSKLLALGMAAVMTAGMLAGCGSDKGGSDSAPANECFPARRQWDGRKDS